MQIRRVKTASGATAVQLVQYRNGRREILEHLGSAHDDGELALLEHLALERVAAGQPAFDLDGLVPAPAPPRARTKKPKPAPVVAGSARTVGSRPRLLWEVLGTVYDRIGFHQAIDSEVFRSLVLGRVISPASKTATLRMLAEMDVAEVPGEATMWRHLARHQQSKWRDAACTTAYGFAAGDGAVSVCLYDVTTLYFETDEEDETRKVGFSKERRVDPQIVIGLLVDKTGFPLEIHCFEGSKAETLTLIPVLDAFRTRHQVTDMLVVADAGMLSRANLEALEEAGYQYIVGSRTSKAPYDLAERLAMGNNFTDGQVLEATTELKRGVVSSRRRAVWQYRLAREHRDRRTQTLQLQRAEDIAAGRKQPRKARFLTGGGPKSLKVDYEAARAAEQLFGLKGYITSAPMEVLSGAEVVAAYHSLFEVEASFRMAKSDLRARPIFHRTRESIEAHLTMVFCALAVGRYIQTATGMSIKKVVQTLQPLREAVLQVRGETIAVPAALTADAQAILEALQINPAEIGPH
ncbi:IS1634 family transposase [Citricoccus nitrophenolicus]|uniref:IS1634 family transposase n=1 Tax=Citricoccus nitrophenolicus TaxID=863575 RepID=UPI0039B5EBDD